MTNINQDLTKEIQRLTEENKVLKSEVLFWRYFYSESIRLFGDKKGELKPMLKKVMSIIQLDCRAKANDDLSDKEITEPQKRQKGFNQEKFIRYCEAKDKESFSKKYPPSIHLEYLDLIGYGDALAKNEQDDIRNDKKINALRFLQEKYDDKSKLSSFIKSLERLGVTNLPPRRSIENIE